MAFFEIPHVRYRMTERVGLSVVSFCEDSEKCYENLEVRGFFCCLNCLI